MKVKVLITVLTVLVLGYSALSYADTIDLRVRHAHAQIERGIHSGSLTRVEAHRLTGELNKVRDDEARMKADGRLNHFERERLNKELDRLERHISNFKRNDNTREHNDGRRDRDYRRH